MPLRLFCFYSVQWGMMDGVYKMFRDMQSHTYLSLRGWGDFFKNRCAIKEAILDLSKIPWSIHYSFKVKEIDSEVRGPDNPIWSVSEC